MNRSKLITPEVGRHFLEHMTSVMNNDEKTGLRYSLGDEPFDNVIHIGCNSVESYRNISVWARRIYFAFCSDINIFNSLRESHRHESSYGNSSLLVSFSQAEIYTGTKKFRSSIDLIYFDNLNSTARRTEERLRTIILNLLKETKKLVIHTILADSLGESSTISAEEVWSGIDFAREWPSTIPPTFFPLSFYAKIAEETGRSYVGVAVGESFIHEGKQQFTTHYLVYESP